LTYAEGIPTGRVIKTEGHKTYARPVDLGCQIGNYHISCCIKDIYEMPLAIFYVSGFNKLSGMIVASRRH
jgi:hypothetical protein